LNIYLNILEYIKSIDTYLSDGTGWFVFANYQQGRKTMPYFASLDAFYPGLLVRYIQIYIFFFFMSERFSLLALYGCIQIEDQSL
jgi:hypothetical protein